MPFEIRRTWIEQVAHNVLGQRTYREFGLRLSDKLASVMLQHTRDPRNSQWLRRVLRPFGFNRRYSISCFDHPREIVGALSRLKPDG